MPEILQKIIRSQVPVLLTFRIPSPLQIDTANASMDSPTPIRNNSIKIAIFFTAFFLYQTFSVIFPQLFCTVCAISAVISNFPHVFTDNIYLLNMSKKETPRIFCTGYPRRYPYKNIHESHSLRFARL